MLTSMGAAIHVHLCNSISDLRMLDSGTGIFTLQEADRASRNTPNYAVLQWRLRMQLNALLISQVLSLQCGASLITGLYYPISAQQKRDDAFEVLLDHIVKNKIMYVLLYPNSYQSAELILSKIPEYLRPSDVCEFVSEFGDQELLVKCVLIYKYLLSWIPALR